PTPHTDPPSLHDALPIWPLFSPAHMLRTAPRGFQLWFHSQARSPAQRIKYTTSELAFHERRLSPASIMAISSASTTTQSPRKWQDRKSTRLNSSHGSISY